MPINLRQILGNVFGGGKYQFCLVVLPLVILLPVIAQFPFPQASQYSDVAISHFPNAYFLSNRLRIEANTLVVSPIY
jgi:hypothetical protein